MPHDTKSALRLLPVAVLLAAGAAMPVHAQPAQNPGAAAISEAVQEGSNPYRPPSTPTANPQDAKRARCEDMLRELSGMSKQRGYTSPGTATQSAQGRNIPKIERDDTRKQLEQTYRANCT